jgi:hypothetical protein
MSLEQEARVALEQLGTTTKSVRAAMQCMGIKGKRPTAAYQCPIARYLNRVVPVDGHGWIVCAEFARISGTDRGVSMTAAAADFVYHYDARKFRELEEP